MKIKTTRRSYRGILINIFWCDGLNGYHSQQLMRTAAQERAYYGTSEGLAQ